MSNEMKETKTTASSHLTESTLPEEGRNFVEISAVEIPAIAIEAIRAGDLEKFKELDRKGYIASPLAEYEQLIKDFIDIIKLSTPIEKMLPSVNPVIKYLILEKGVIDIFDLTGPEERAIDIFNLIESEKHRQPKPQTQVQAILERELTELKKEIYANAQENVRKRGLPDHIQNALKDVIEQHLNEYTKVGFKIATKKCTDTIELLSAITAYLDRISDTKAYLKVHDYSKAKYVHKRAVLNEALLVIKGEPGHDSNSLKKVMEQNHLYNSSKVKLVQGLWTRKGETEQLLARVFELKGQPTNNNELKM